MDLERIRAERADVIVIATGAQPALVRFESESAQPFDVTTAMRGDGDIGKHVLVAMGPSEHGKQAVPMAELLLQQGHDVTLVFRRPSLMAGAGPELQFDAYTRLVRLGAKLVPDCELVNYRDHTAEIRNIFSQRTDRIACDTVVCAYGGTAQDALFTAMMPAGDSVYQVGDCVAPRDVRGAVRDAQMLVAALVDQETKA
jgi:pyruvate/2-oxoglutarate dehydrogenase complex dihydrolipoamide dehydrogenase (E3) component